MNYPTLHPLKLFIIDTDSYAGNFERAMCAYCTGQIGECEVGKSEAEDYKDEVGEPMENVFSMPDDHGCNRPVTITPSPDGVGCNSIGIYFEDDFTEEQIETIKRRAVEFGKSHRTFLGDPDPIEILGFRIETFITTMTSKDV